MMAKSSKKTKPKTADVGSSVYTEISELKAEILQLHAMTMALRDVVAGQSVALAALQSDHAALRLTVVPEAINRVEGAIQVAVNRLSTQLALIGDAIVRAPKKNPARGNLRRG